MIASIAAFAVEGKTPQTIEPLLQHTYDATQTTTALPGLKQFVFSELLMHYSFFSTVQRAFARFQAVLGKLDFDSSDPDF